MLEGKELEGKIGSDGKWEVDVMDSGLVKATASYGVSGVQGGTFLELDIVMLLEKLAVKTSNTIDDALVAAVKKALGRP